MCESGGGDFTEQVSVHRGQVDMMMLDEVQLLTCTSTLWLLINITSISLIWSLSSSSVKWKHLITVREVWSWSVIQTVSSVTGKVERFTAERKYFQFRRTELQDHMVLSAIVDMKSDFFSFHFVTKFCAQSPESMHTVNVYMTHRTEDEEKSLSSSSSAQLHPLYFMLEGNIPSNSLWSSHHDSPLVFHWMNRG